MKISQHDRGLTIDCENGGVRFRVGGLLWVVSPQAAVEIAKAILQCAGVNVVFANPGQTIVTPGGDGSLEERIKREAAKIILPD
jgi:hypothetical protein